MRRTDEGHGCQSMDVVMAGVMGRAPKGPMSAGRAWNEVAGRSERAHTRGLYLEECPDGSRVLHVYVDSSCLLQDFSTDHLLYEHHLAAIGFAVERVVFELSRRTGTAKAEGPCRLTAAEPRPQPLSSLGPLTAAEAEGVRRCCEVLPEGLRTVAEEAMGASLRRAKGSGPTERP